MKIQKFFYFQNVIDSLLQVTCVILYFNDILKRRTQRFQLTENSQLFLNWHDLQLWLTINYDRHSARINANLTMKRIKMKKNKKVNNFINCFETIVTNMSWNESTICSIFRKKLNKDILDTVYFLHSKNWSVIFVIFKTLTQNAENHLRIEKRIWDNEYNDMINDYQKRKRILFSSESKGHRSRRNKFENWSNCLQQNYAVKKERRRKKNLCLNFEKKNHWANDFKCANKSKLRKVEAKKKQRSQLAKNWNR